MKCDHHNSEPLDHWRRIVAALWSLNDLNMGVRRIMPRGASVPECLSTLEALIPLIEQPATAEILEHELKSAENDLVLAAQALTGQAQFIHELLSLFEQQKSFDNSH
jgi:hypothetical protein